MRAVNQWAYHMNRRGSDGRAGLRSRPPLAVRAHEREKRAGTQPRPSTVMATGHVVGMARVVPIEPHPIVNMHKYAFVGDR